MAHAGRHVPGAFRAMLRDLAPFGCVGLVVDPAILGTATGIMLSIGSGMGAIYPIIAGIIYENYKD